MINGQTCTSIAEIVDHCGNYYQDLLTINRSVWQKLKVVSCRCHVLLSASVDGCQRFLIGIFFAQAQKKCE